MNRRITIVCPSCGKHGEVDPTSTGPHANDDCDAGKMLAPEGFRKVQFGWSSNRLRLCCTSCGIASEYHIQSISCVDVPLGRKADGVDEC